MDQYHQILLIAFFVIAIRVTLATVATKRGRWGWRPWGVIGLEFFLEIILPAHEPVFSVASLITLITMCIVKRKPKEIETKKETENAEPQSNGRRTPLL
jgi:uncharacterized membrane protein